MKRRSDADDLWAHFLVVGGRVVGGWRRLLEKNAVTARARPLRTLRPSEKAALEAAAKRYAAFVEMPVRILWN